VPDDVATRVGQVLHDVQVTGRYADRVKRIVALLMLNNFSVDQFPRCLYETDRICQFYAFSHGMSRGENADE
jgi:hypothetical protein